MSLTVTTKAFSSGGAIPKSNCTLYSSSPVESAGWLMRTTLMGSDVPLKLSEMLLDEKQDAQGPCAAAMRCKAVYARLRHGEANGDAIRGRPRQRERDFYRIHRFRRTQKGERGPGQVTHRGIAIR